ncbi:MAG: HD domain-containing protein [Treponema sp.]|jgi:HD superfamily phosphohydrolase|nr:HD domain-containing protein [Treponema sp.]
MDKTIEASLKEDYTRPVRDVLWGHIYMTEEFAKLTESAPFMRLCRIHQLGPVYLLYPGATHTRASHSIGVYHLGRRLLQNLTERGAAQWLSPQGVKSFLAACLLHDLGHFPYTHSLKELPLVSHESLTGAVILKEPMKSLVGNTGADPQFTAAIVDKEMTVTDSGGPAGTELFFYRRLLSGALDPDKLDYLNRDARYCGVPYGSQDVDFILSRLIPDKERGTDIDSRLIPNVESVLFSKYLMYRTVYWHRQVRSATAMVKKALIKGLNEGIFTGEELYNLDDHSLFGLLGRKTDCSLTDSVREGRIYSTAAEISSELTVNSNIKDISARSQIEKKLIERLNRAGIPVKEEDLIIDIPEPVSFETGLYVSDEKCSFSQSSSAFKTDTVNSFIKTLYIIRIFINQKYHQKLKTLPDLYDMMYGSLK